MSHPPDPSQRRLSALMRKLRRDAGLSTYTLAGVLGWTQSRVSRIETGRAQATADDVDAWADATNASEADRDQMAGLAYGAWTHIRSWHSSHRQGLAARQREMGEFERAATAVRHFQPAVIPGLLQSPAYARHVITMGDVTGRGDVDEAVAARMRRQDVLREDRCRFEYILAEGALRWRPGPADLMAEQREHLLAAAALDAVTLMVIPFDQEARTVYEHGFALFDIPDAPTVLIEQYGGERFIAEPRELAVYERVFGVLRDSALTGDAAVDFIRAVLS